jgi:hypothetical protein
MAEVRKASVSVNEEGQISEINPHLGENEDSDSEDEGKRTQLVGLDVNKIVEYPGFNMPSKKSSSKIEETIFSAEGNQRSIQAEVEQRSVKEKVHRLLLASK